MSQLKQNKSSGHDDITSNVAIHVMDSIRKPLFHLISTSFGNALFPNGLKTAEINPILKKGETYMTSNYRPISLLPVFSKRYERIIYDQIYNYLTSNKLLYKYQFGFQRICSTEYAILNLVNKMSTYFDNNEFVLRVFIDLSKAFDTVDHDILLSKL